jgi:type IV secretion system protein VirB1
MLELIGTCIPPGVAPDTVEVVIQHESSGNPYAVNVNGEVNKSIHFTLPEVAIKYVEKNIARGHSVDMGLMQVNSMHLNRFNASVANMFDACKNIRFGAQILIDCYRLASRRFDHNGRALAAALSCYNTGRLTGAKGREYVRKLLRRLK